MAPVKEPNGSGVLGRGHSPAPIQPISSLNPTISQTKSNGSPVSFIVSPNASDGNRKVSRRMGCDDTFHLEKSRVKPKLRKSPYERPLSIVSERSVWDANPL